MSNDPKLPPGAPARPPVPLPVTPRDIKQDRGAPQPQYAQDVFKQGKAEPARLPVGTVTTTTTTTEREHEAELERKRTVETTTVEPQRTVRPNVPVSNRREPITQIDRNRQPAADLTRRPPPATQAPAVRPPVKVVTQKTADGGTAHVFTTVHQDGSQRIKANTVTANGSEVVRITTVDTHGNQVVARTRGVDNWTARAPQQQYTAAVSSLRGGGSGYHRDVQYSTRVTTTTTVIINNNSYYQPESHRGDNRIGGFIGGLFAGLVAGAVTQATLDQYNEGFNGCPLHQPYSFPPAVWQPYYQQVLYQPLPPVYPVVQINYQQPMAWQTPPPYPLQDPLEQLAEFGQLQAPGYAGLAPIGALQARALLSRGYPVVVGGLEVFNYQQLAQVAEEMTYNQIPRFNPEQQQQMAAILAGRGNCIEDTIANLPSFQQVYSPRSLVAEDEINGHMINRTMDAASAVYDRPEVKEAIAEWWQQYPQADRSQLNQAINAIVTSALVNDLSVNRNQYAMAPDLADNPVPYLQNPTFNPYAVQYNEAAINNVIAGAAQQLQQNLIVAQY